MVVGPAEGARGERSGGQHYFRPALDVLVSARGGDERQLSVSRTGTGGEEGQLVSEGCRQAGPHAKPHML